MKLVYVLVVALLLAVPAMAFDENTKINVVFTGDTPLSSLLTSKDANRETILKTATVDTFTLEKYPLAISTTVTIDKFRCEKEKCAYWITATRGGKEVAVNNPIWLMNSNVPFHVIVSEVEDTKTNTLMITVREDLKGSVFQILQDCADRQPLGKLITGTKV